MKMRKLSLLFASIFFFFTLQSCYSSSSTEQMAQDITYVMEEQVHYPNARYLPLLDALERFEDFKTKVNEEDKKNRGDLDSKAEWVRVLYEDHDKGERILVQNVKKHVMDLLNGKETINEYLHYMITQRNLLLFEQVHQTASFLLSPQPKSHKISNPLSKKLFDFFIEDPLFQKNRDHLKEIQLNSINNNELINQMIQIPLDLTETNELDDTSKRLLLLFQPNATIGGPYALLEDIIFADDLVGEKKKAGLALRKLLEFDKLRKLYPSNFSFMKALFNNIYNHTFFTITLHFLQLTEAYNLKMFYGLNAPNSLLFFYDFTGNGLNIIVPETIKPAIEKLLTKQKKAEGTIGRNKQICSVSKPYRNRRQNHKRWSPAVKSIEGDKFPKIEPKKEKKESSDFPKKEEKEKLIIRQLEKPTANNYLDRPDLSDEKNEPTISFTAAEEEKNDVPQTSGDIAVKLNAATINGDTKAASIPYDQATVVNTNPIKTEGDEAKVTLTIPYGQTIVVNTNPIKTKTEEITALHFSIGNRVDDEDVSLITSFEKNEFLPGKASEKHTHTGLSPKGSKQKKKKKSAPLTIVAPAVEPTSIQKKETDSTVGIELNKRFVMPRGLRTFHATMIQKAYSPIADPKHQDIIDQLFDLRQQCNTTYHQFKVLWSANGGFIIDNRGSHRTLQFPINVNLFGIYKPHGSSAGYGKNTVGYLQAAVLYIGLRPTDW